MVNQSEPQMNQTRLTGLSIFLIGLISLIFIGGIVFGISWFVVTGTAQGYENDIKFAYQEQENYHSNNNKIMEASGLTVKNYGDTVIKAIEAKAKQYEGKENMLAQFTQERPNDIPVHIWEKYMDLYEKDTAEIRNKQSQTKALEGSYGKWLAKETGGRLASKFNFPTPEIKKIMNTVISTSSSKKTFQTGIDTEVKTGF